MDIQETEFGGPAPSKQKKIIHFSSGETLEVADSEEEEESSGRPPFSEPAQRTGFSFKNMAILVGRISLLACDFLGEKLAGALGLNAAKYQYAIDQHHHHQKKTSTEATDVVTEGQAETFPLSPGHDKNIYGATGGSRCPDDPQEGCEEIRRTEGYHNRGYQVEEDFLN